MNPEMLENIPHAWMQAVAFTTALLFMAAVAAAFFLDHMGKAKKAIVFTAVGVFAAAGAVSGTVTANEWSRFEASNTETVSRWLDSAYGLEASESDRDTISRVIIGDAPEQSFTFNSDEGPLVAKVVESPDGNFGLVKVSEPVEMLDVES